MAIVDLRWRPVKIQPTQGFADEKPISMNLVHVHEAEAPGGLNRTGVAVADQPGGDRCRRDHRSGAALFVALVH